MVGVSGRFAGFTYSISSPSVLTPSEGGTDRHRLLADEADRQARRQGEEERVAVR
jgi:hypothetical protein